jgi:hypothetical protein
MSARREKGGLSRREFMGRSARHVALLGVGTALGALRASPASSAKRRGENPFAYDLRDLQKTDPKLIHYEEVSRFKCPRADSRKIVCGPDERLYVAAGNYVTVLTTEGAAGLEIALAEPARCLGVGKDGTLYVGCRSHVEVFDSKGRRTAAWEPPGERTWLTGLAVGEKDVFAADAGARLVWRYDRSGRLVGRIGEKDKDRNIPGFVVPSPYFDVELHRDGLLRVTNPGRHRVEAYTFDGDLEQSWGRPSAAIDGFCGCCNPINIAVLNDGRLVTCEKGLPRVKVYGVAGQFESVVAGPEAFPEVVKASNVEAVESARIALDVTVDTRSRIYVLDPAANSVRVMARKPSAAQTAGARP